MLVWRNVYLVWDTASLDFYFTTSCRKGKGSEWWFSISVVYSRRKHNLPDRSHSNKRCHRTACIHWMQFKGLGVPNKYFATQNKQMYIRLHCLRVLWSLSRCFPNLKIILQIRPSVFQVQLEADGYFFAQDFFAIASTASRASWY